MRTAFVSTIIDYPWGGADFLWTRAAEAAVERGDSIFLAVSQEVAGHPRIAALRACGAVVFIRSKESVPISLGARLTRRFHCWFGTADPLVKALGRFRPDLVVFSCGATYDLAYFPGWINWLCSTRTPFRIIANWQMEQPVLPITEKERILRLFAVAKTLCFVSTRNLENTRRHLHQDLPQARVVHNPLRWQETDKCAWPVSPPWNFATVSRLNTGKGIGLFLRAAALVLPRTDDWTINIHGVGPEELSLKTLTTDLGLQQRVNFHGYVPDLRTIWGNNHLMVSPSLEDGVPMTIPEALLCRRPILATAVGGAEDWISDGVSGFISSAPSLELFAQALQRAWAQRHHWETMGEAGAAATSERYRPNDYLQIIER